MDYKSIVPPVLRYKLGWHQRWERKSTNLSIRLKSWIINEYIQRVAQLLAAWLRENGERMRKWRGNGERMRKWREIHSQDFLILCLFPPSLSISYIKNCHILSQNIKYNTFVANVTKKLNIHDVKKNFLVAFAARKLRKLWGPVIESNCEGDQRGDTCAPSSFLTKVELIEVSECFSTLWGIRWGWGKERYRKNYWHLKPGLWRWNFGCPSSCVPSS